MELEFDETKGELVFSTPTAEDVKALIKRGDLAGATKAYEAGGGRQRDELLSLAQQVPSRANTILQVFMSAHDHAGAARMQELGGNHTAAAALYETARMYPNAATCWAAAGNTARAASAMERTGELERARELYSAAGSREDEAAVLMRQGRFFAASQLFSQLGNVHAEVEVLRKVVLTDPDRVVSTRRLAHLLEQHGHLEAALAVVGETAQALPAARADRELQGAFVRLLEALGRGAEAAKVRTSLGLPATSPGAALPAAPPPAPSGVVGAFERAYEYLKAIPIFQDLSLVDLQDLYRVARETTVPAGTAIIEQGRQGLGLYILVAGSVDVTTAVAGGGPPKHLNTLSDGAHLGEISLVQDAPTSARVVARTQAALLFISRDAFQRFLELHEAAAIAIWRHFAVSLADRVRVLSAR